MMPGLKICVMDITYNYEKRKYEKEGSVINKIVCTYVANKYSDSVNFQKK